MYTYVGKHFIPFQIFICTALRWRCGGCFFSLLHSRVFVYSAAADSVASSTCGGGGIYALFAVHLCACVCLHLRLRSAFSPHRLRRAGQNLLYHFGCLDVGTASYLDSFLMHEIYLVLLKLIWMRVRSISSQFMCVQTINKIICFLSGYAREPDRSNSVRDVLARRFIYIVKMHSLPD